MVVGGDIIKTKIITMFLGLYGYVTEFYNYAMAKIDFHWKYQSQIAHRQLAERSRFAKFSSNTSGDTAMGGGLITAIIGIVIAFRVFISIMPATISDAKAVTDSNGSGAGWDDSEKAMWGLISLLMIVFGIFIALYAMRQRG